MARPKGPEKELILLRLLKPTATRLRKRAKALGYKSLQAYLVESIEDQAAVKK